MVGNLRYALIFLLWTFTLIAAPLKVPREDFYRDWPNTRSHPGFSPFIGYLSFRNICNHFIDQSTEWFDPQVVRQGDIIYLNVWYLDWFVKEVHDRIQHPYILMTCDVGSWLPFPRMKKLLHDPKLAAWFCRNLIFSGHPKLIQIPMGQDMALFSLDPAAIHPLKQITQTAPFLKKHLLYMNHFPRRQGQREEIVKLFENAPFCLSRNQSDQTYSPIPIDLYYQELVASRFTLSPVGLETDCVRTWEALVLDCIPIVEHTFLDPLFEGLPVIFVHDWEEVTQEFLEKKEFSGRNVEKAYFPYWRDLILKTQERIQKNDLFASQKEVTLFPDTQLKDLVSLLSSAKQLIYKGFFTGLRPLQLASAIDAHIDLYDPWVDDSVRNSKINRIALPYILDGYQFEFDQLLDRKESYAVFLDLTYYRNSLLTDFTKDFGNFRHLLKRHLKELLDRLPLFTLLCGNQVEDPFVKEVLERFARETGVLIQQTDSIWYIVKGN